MLHPDTFKVSAPSTFHAQVAMCSKSQRTNVLCDLLGHVTSCVPCYRAKTGHQDYLSLVKKTIKCIHKNMKTPFAVRCLQMCLCNQIFLLMDLQGWSQQPRGNWTGNNRQSTSWRYRKKKKPTTTYYMRGFNVILFVWLCYIPPLNRERVEMSPGRSSRRHNPWWMVLSFWLKVLVLSECNDSSRVIICTQAGGRRGGRSCSSWRLISQTPGVARAQWLPSLPAVLHADEADNLSPFLTLETQTDSRAAPSLLPYDLLNASE